MKAAADSVSKNDCTEPGTSRREAVQLGECRADS